MHSVIVFDLGGTLMQYRGMPLSWIDYYRDGFRAIAKRLNIQSSDEMIEDAVKCMKGFNPRVNYREIEHPPEYIFSDALKQWNIDIPINECIDAFWEGLHLRAEIFTDAREVLPMLRRKGCIIAAMTDLPNGMPDERFKRDIAELIAHFDMYVSSSVAGYRKPNAAGLRMIAERYQIPVCDLIFVGDEEKDRMTALNAGCRFIPISRNGNGEDCICDLYGLLRMIE